MYVPNRFGLAITYIGTAGHNHYLSLVTDAYSKKIMGYDLSDSLAIQGAVRALKMALKARKSSEELIRHSDRGIQYCCDALENAIAERVNGIVKDEFELERHCGSID